MHLFYFIGSVHGIFILVFGSNGSGIYSAYTYNNRSIEIINQHDPSTPLFMYIALQNLHAPQQVSVPWLSLKIAFVAVPFALKWKSGLVRVLSAKRLACLVHS
jgi:hypothetical protein